MTCHSCGRVLPRRTKLCHCWIEEDKRLRERFYSKTKLVGDHLLWMNASDKNGYGRFRFRDENWPAHRVAWYLVTGEIPFEINHKCEIECCVRTFHLEDVSHHEHNLFTFREFFDHKCPRGHDKTFYPNKGKYGTWDCRTCNSDRMAKRGDWYVLS